VDFAVGRALYALLSCWIAYRLARDLWSEREGIWAAGLLRVFLISIFLGGDSGGVRSVDAAPHMAAVWMAWKASPFWAGVLAAVPSGWPKGLFVAAALPALGSRVSYGCRGFAASLFGSWWFGERGRPGSLLGGVWKWEGSTLAVHLSRIP